MSFQTPDPIALAHSTQLTQLIRQEIAASDGLLSFARFMALALYAPGLGYYSAGQHKLGRYGDFVTAPEISPLFAKSIARQCQQILAATPQGDILEFGAGSGLFAKDLLLALEALNTLPANYFILEISADLRERQQRLLAESIPHLLNRIHWLDALPVEKINGIIFANEVLDALPVHLFSLDKEGIKERCVTWENGQFGWQEVPAAGELKREVALLLEHHALPTGYHSEINLLLPAWIQSVVSLLNTGIILLVDYGYSRTEYYHPDRRQGTLMCYSQHRKHDNPLEWVGLQDITAHVDFTYLIENVDLNACSLGGFTTQADFLLGCGLLAIAEEENIPDPLKQYQQAQAIKKLLLPGEMGELVKVMALKKFSAPLLGFSLQDRRHTL